MYDLSIVIPTFNSSGYICRSLAAIHNHVHPQVSRLQYVIVNNGGGEDLVNSLREFREGYPHVVIINLEENQGQQTAVQLGLQHAEGQFLLTTDDDLQYDPADMVALYDSIRNDDAADIYCGYAFVKTRSAVYALISFIVSFLSNRVFFPRYRRAHYYTPLKVFRRGLLFREQEWLKKNVYFFWIFDPSRIRSAAVTQHQRLHGSGNYNLWRYLDFYKHIILKMLHKLVSVLVLITVAAIVLGGEWNPFLAILGSEVLILIIIRILLGKWYSDQAEEYEIIS